MLKDVRTIYFNFPKMVNTNEIQNVITILYNQKTLNKS